MTLGQIIDHHSRIYGNRIPIIICVLLVIIYIVLNIFSIGGVSFVIGLNNNLSNLLALGVTILAIIIWRQLAGTRNRSLWAGLAFGWALWTIAEFWWAIASIISKEIPYPSIADLFWLIGYIPMYIALWLRFRSLPKNNSRLKIISIWSISMIVLGSTILFVLVPILKNYDSTLLLESILNLLYPFVDLVLVIFTLWIFFAYQQGSYGRTWIWLSVGFLLHSLSNLSFSYATSVNLYYPQGKTNLISTLAIDIPYTLSYLAWIIGMLIFIRMQNRYQPYIKPEGSLNIIPNTHIIIFTKRDETVIGVSQNYQMVFPFNKVEGKALSEIMGISENEAKNICEEIKVRNILQDRPIEVKTLLGNRTARLCGISNIPPHGEYEGSIFLIRVMMADNSLDTLLSDYEKTIMRNVMKQTGAKEADEEEIKQFLSGYYSAYLKTLYNWTLEEGGAILADALSMKLRSVSDQYGWQISNHPDFLLDTKHSTLLETKIALSVLLENSKQFASNVIGEYQVGVVIKNVDSWFDDAVHEYVNHFTNNYQPPDTLTE